MARITLFPTVNDAQIDGYLAQGVDYTGIDPTIHCVQWYDTIGSIEYVEDPITGEKPQNTTIDSVDPYLPYVQNAQAIIDAYLNPQSFYITQNGTLFGGLTFYIGNEIFISTVDGQPPDSSTPDAPPTQEDWQTLYWYDDAWVVSPVDPSLTLTAAKLSLIATVQANAAQNVADQARIYSPVQLGTAADVTQLATADYAGVTLGDYQAQQDSEVSTMTAAINAASSVPDLYSFNPTVPA